VIQQIGTSMKAVVRDTPRLMSAFGCNLVVVWCSSFLYI